MSSTEYINRLDLGQYIHQIKVIQCLNLKPSRFLRLQPLLKL